MHRYNSKNQNDGAVIHQKVKRSSPAVNRGLPFPAVDFDDRISSITPDSINNYGASQPQQQNQGFSPTSNNYTQANHFQGRFDNQMGQNSGGTPDSANGGGIAPLVKQ